MQRKEKELPRYRLDELIPNAPPAAIDLLSKLFTWDPAERLTAKQAIEHPFFEELHEAESDKPKEAEPCNFFDFEYEQYDLDINVIRELLLDEIVLANSSEARSIYRKLRKAHEGGILSKIFDS